MRPDETHSKVAQFTFTDNLFEYEDMNVLTTSEILIIHSLELKL